jgi:hypothetical protein
MHRKADRFALKDPLIYATIVKGYKKLWETNERRQNVALLISRRITFEALAGAGVGEVSSREFSFRSFVPMLLKGRLPIS